jgi:hypothetical protein
VVLVHNVPDTNVPPPGVSEMASRALVAEGVTETDDVAAIADSGA